MTRHELSRKYREIPDADLVREIIMHAGRSSTDLDERLRNGHLAWIEGLVADLKALAGVRVDPRDRPAEYL